MPGLNERKLSRGVEWGADYVTDNDTVSTVQIVEWRRKKKAFYEENISARNKAAEVYKGSSVTFNGKPLFKTTTDLESNSNAYWMIEEEIDGFLSVVFKDESEKRIATLFLLANGKEATFKSLASKHLGVIAKPFRKNSSLEIGDYSDLKIVWQNSGDRAICRFQLDAISLTDKESSYRLGKEGKLVTANNVVEHVILRVIGSLELVVEHDIPSLKINGISYACYAKELELTPKNKQVESFIGVWGRKDPKKINKKLDKIEQPFLHKFEDRDKIISVYNFNRDYASEEVNKSIQQWKESLSIQYNQLVDEQVKVTRLVSNQDVTFAGKALLVSRSDSKAEVLDAADLEKESRKNEKTQPDSDAQQIDYEQSRSKLLHFVRLGTSAESLGKNTRPTLKENVLVESLFLFGGTEILDFLLTEFADKAVIADKEVNDLLKKADDNKFRAMALSPNSKDAVAKTVQEKATTVSFNRSLCIKKMNWLYGEDCLNCQLEVRVKMVSLAGKYATEYYVLNDNKQLVAVDKAQQKVKIKSIQNENDILVFHSTIRMAFNNNAPDFSVESLVVDSYTSAIQFKDSGILNKIYSPHAKPPVIVEEIKTQGAGIEEDETMPLLAANRPPKKSSGFWCCGGNDKEVAKETQSTDTVPHTPRAQTMVK